MIPVPPDAAFAVDNIVDARVRAALAEARRIRDTWQAALEEAREAARQEAQATAAQALAHQLHAVEAHRAQTTARLATAAEAEARRLAALLVGEAHAARPDRADWIAAALASGQWTHVRVPHALPDPPPGVIVEVDPALLPGEVILSGPGGVVDARYAARIARLTT